MLTGVFFSKLIGPVSSRFALTRAGEAGSDTRELQQQSPDQEQYVTGAVFCSLDDTFRIIPWKWQKLKVPESPQGYVIFHAIEPATVRGLARTASILAYHYKALPLAVRVVPSDETLPEHLFLEEHAEVHSMGYSLATELVPGADIAAGIVAAVECNDARAVVLAYPLKGAAEKFRHLLEMVADHVHCPVAVVRFHVSCILREFSYP